MVGKVVKVKKGTAAKRLEKPPKKAAEPKVEDPIKELEKKLGAAEGKAQVAISVLKSIISQANLTRDQLLLEIQKAITRISRYDEQIKPSPIVRERKND